MQIHSSEKASKTGIYNQVFTNSLALAWNSILLYFFIVYYRMDFFKLTFVASSTTFRTLANYRILVSLNNHLLFKNSLISKTSHRCSCTKMSSIYYLRGIFFCFAPLKCVSAMESAKTGSSFNVNAYCFCSFKKYYFV